MRQIHTTDVECCFIALQALRQHWEWAKHMVGDYFTPCRGWWSVVGTWVLARGGAHGSRIILTI
jgi:hypothetical protein